MGLAAVTVLLRPDLAKIGHCRRETFMIFEKKISCFIHLKPCSKVAANLLFFYMHDNWLSVHNR